MYLGALATGVIYLIQFLLLCLGIGFYVYALYSYKKPEVQPEKRNLLFVFGTGLVVIFTFLLVRNPGHKFVGTYVDWNNNAKAIQLNNDGSFHSNFPVHGARTGNWELIDSDEFYFIELTDSNGLPLARIRIKDRNHPIKLDLRPSERPPYEQPIELVEF